MSRTEPLSFSIRGDGFLTVLEVFTAIEKLSRAKTYSNLLRRQSSPNMYHYASLVACHIRFETEPY